MNEPRETFPEYLRRVGADHRESGRDCTAEDYEAAARIIERLRVASTYGLTAARERGETRAAANIAARIDEAADTDAALAAVQKEARP